MEARLPRAPLARFSFLSFALLAAATFVAPPRAHGAGYRTTNFVVNAPTPALAKEIGDAAEAWRKQLAVEWLGVEMPAWSQSCPITVQVAPNLGAGGATSFVFDHGEVFGWKMDIQGSRERVLDSVLPHEITHTIFASYFRRPLPRWADEGACTTVEHRSEIAKQEELLIKYLHTGRGIAFDAMFAMKEYPQDVLPLYAQGYALSQYLIGQRGKREFLEFIADGMEDENWPRAIQTHYGYEHLLALQNSWLDWVRAGKPPIAPRDDATAIAARDASPARPPIVRGQDPGSRTQATAASFENREAPDDVTPTPTNDDVAGGWVPADGASAAVYDASAATGTMLR